ncbi:MAG: hypothetical protein WCA46_22300 [Actinocatenispora sp.]
MTAPQSVPRMNATSTPSAFAAPVPAQPVIGGPVMPPPMPPSPPTDRLPGVSRRAALYKLLQPVAEKPQSRMRKLVLASIWGLVLCLGGMVVGIWALVRIIAGMTTPWYEPVIIVVGLVGLALTVGAYPMLERRGLSWLLLAAGTCVLGVAFAITVMV